MASTEWEFVREVMQMRGVRKKLDEVAARGAAQVSRIASAEGVKVAPARSSGTRPKGRPYSRIALGDGAQEFGDSKTVRRRILGRAASALTRKAGR